jgi:nickel transport protein
MPAVPRFGLLLLLGLNGLVALMPLPASAHAIESTLTYLDGTLELSGTFSSGEPTRDAVVRLLNPDGTPGLELGRMDAEGKLQVALPAELHNANVELQVDGGPGHRDYLELPIREGRVQLDQVSDGHPQGSGVWGWTALPSPLGRAALLGGVAVFGSAGWLVRVRRSRQG